MVRRFAASHSIYRPRVLHLWVVATTTLTHSAESTVDKAGTDKRSDALLLVTPAPRRGDVSCDVPKDDLFRQLVREG